MRFFCAKNNSSTNRASRISIKISERTESVEELKEKELFVSLRPEYSINNYPTLNLLLIDQKHFLPTERGEWRHA